MSESPSAGRGGWPRASAPRQDERDEGQSGDRRSPGRHGHCPDFAGDTRGGAGRERRARAAANRCGAHRPPGARRAPRPGAAAVRHRVAARAWATASSPSPPTSRACRRSPEAFEEHDPARAPLPVGLAHGARTPRAGAWSGSRFAPFESHGRRVGYADIPGDVRTPEIEWLRANPHRLHLGRHRLPAGEGGRRSARSRATSPDVEQRLDLWNGVLVSRFRLDGQPVRGRDARAPGARRCSRCGCARRCCARAPRVELAVPVRHAARRRPPTGRARTRTARGSCERGARAAVLERRLDADTLLRRARAGPRRRARRSRPAPTSW